MKLSDKLSVVIVTIITTLVLIPSINGTFHGYSNDPSLKETQPMVLKSIQDWSNWIRDINENKLDDLIDNMIFNGSNEDELINIYINYQTWPSTTDVTELNILGINISYQAKYIPTICAREVPLNKVKEILTLPNIAMIEKQPYLTKALDVSAGSIKARESSFYSPETAWELGYTGREVNIAILDTGIDDRHESLTNKFVAGFDCTLRVPRETNPDDEDGHGTHCAGIAVGTGGDDGQYIGIAPNAKLLDVKVLNDIGLTPGDQVLQGIDWCINQKDEHNISVLSISIGEFFTGNDDGSGTHASEVNRAVSEGLVVVVAAGNDGPNNNGFSSLAAADGAITVGAVDEQESVKRSDDEIASFSNRGPRADDGDSEEIDELKPDVVAPGVDIMSALYSSTQIGLITGYQQLTGTSMACPHVAGLAALVIEANPSLNPEKIKQIIKETSESMGHPSYQDLDPDYNVDYGWGIVDSYEAVKKILGEGYQTIEILSHNTFDKVYNVASIYGTASVSKGRIESVEYNIADHGWNQANGQEDWDFIWDTRIEENGYHNIKLRSYDGIEYSNEFDITLNVVNIRAGISEPLNGSTLKNTVIIKGLSSGKNILTVLIKIGDLSWERVEPTSGANNYTTWEYSWNTKDMSDGVYTISVKADNGEWQSIPNKIEVIVKNKKPTTSGFLNSFDWFLVLTSFLIFIIFRARKKKLW